MQAVPLPGAFDVLELWEGFLAGQVLHLRRVTGFQDLLIQIISVAHGNLLRHHILLSAGVFDSGIHEF